LGELFRQLLDALQSRRREDVLRLDDDHDELGPAELLLDRLDVQLRGHVRRQLILDLRIDFDLAERNQEQKRTDDERGDERPRPTDDPLRGELHGAPPYLCSLAFGTPLLWPQTLAFTHSA